MTIAALFVESQGVYFGMPDLEPWSPPRDARDYAGPHPVIAHPPCERWGRFWHGSPRKPHQYDLGDDSGCFDAALRSLRNYGGVLEHPAQSKAWDKFDLPKPRERGWARDLFSNLWSCEVDQYHYGHDARKPTWLLYCGDGPPELVWGRAPQQIPEWMIERYGYARARKYGVISMIGGKHKKAIRERTPIGFRDLLISLVAPLAQ
jgi:hypothetical protein